MTPLERVHSALADHGSRRSGPSGWTCPAHDDRKASLQVTATTDGKVILNCHADCESSAVVAALGLQWADLFPQPEVGAQRHSTIVAVYGYVDERSRPLFEVVRFAPKDFRQRRSGSSGWVWNLKGTRRVLYRLPRVLDAAKMRQPIYVVEGEKDVAALEQAGAVATCNPGGAGKWQDAYAEALAGASVIVVADRDEAGRKHARTVAASLRAHGCTVQVVEAAEGKDAADHLAGHGLDELVPIDLEEPASQVAATTRPPGPSGAGERVSDLLEAMRAYQHLDDPWVVWFVLACAVSSFLDGDPLWGMPIGPSSGGKTEAIRLVDDIAEHLADLTNAGLLTWIPGKNAHEAGALTRMGQRGLITISDFSTVLASSDRGGRDQLFANLRCVYDGELVRTNGSAPGPLVWKGRATLIAGCTPAIDRYASYTDALGPRWLSYRLAEQDTAAARARARQAQRATKEIDELRAHARATATMVVKAASQRASSIDLPEALLDRLVDVAIVVCLGRGAVPRHGYGKREIDGLPLVESPPRLTLQLTTLARCLLALGLDDKRTLWLCEHAALSSMPSIRLRVLQALAGGEELSVSEVASRAQAHRHPTRFALEELQTIGVTDCDDEDEAEQDGFPEPKRWRLDGPDAVLVADIIAGHPWHEVCAPPTPPPPDQKTNQTEQTQPSAPSHTSCQGAADEPLPPEGDTKAPKAPAHEGVSPSAPSLSPSPPTLEPTPDGRLLDLDDNASPSGQHAYVCDRCGAKRTAFVDMAGLRHPDCPAGPGAHFRAAEEAA